MSQEPICRDYTWLSDIYTQNDNVTRSTSPITDVVDAADAADDDGHKYANELFAQGSELTPAKCIAYTDMYDTNQAVSRSMKLYNLDRSMYYEQAVKDNDINRSRLKHKQTYTANLIAVGDKLKENELGGD